jgi:hypothetical protein
MAATVLLALGGAAQAAAWEDPATLSGLVGSYAGPPGGKVLYVTFGGTDGYRASGPFTRFVVTGRYNAITIQSGQYQAIAQNPAIGAIISFADAAGKELDSWPMIAIQRDPTGKKITALQVVTSDGTVVQLYRVGL